MQTEIGSQQPVLARSPKTQVCWLLILLIGFTPTLASPIRKAKLSGNLLNPRPDGMSHPYPNKDQILTWSRFWKNRFHKELVRDNSLTDGVCLKLPGKLLIFYKENTYSIQMELGKLEGAIQGIAVDTCRDYKEIEIAGLKAWPGQIFKAPRRSDWAVTVQNSCI